MTTSSQPPRKLLDQLRDCLRVQHYSSRTEQAYVAWVRRYTLRVFHHKRHPQDIGAPEVKAFLTHLALDRQVAASTQNQALSALLFLYREVLHQPLSGIDTVRARQPERLPTVLTKNGPGNTFSRPKPARSTHGLASNNATISMKAACKKPFTAPPD